MQEQASQPIVHLYDATRLLEAAVPEGGQDTRQDTPACSEHAAHQADNMCDEKLRTVCELIIQQFPPGANKQLPTNILRAMVAHFDVRGGIPALKDVVSTCRPSSRSYSTAGLTQFMNGLPCYGASPKQWTVSDIMLYAAANAVTEHMTYNVLTSVNGCTQYSCRPMVIDGSSPLVYLESGSSSRHCMRNCPADYWTLHGKKTLLPPGCSPMLSRRGGNVFSPDKTKLKAHFYEYTLIDAARNEGAKLIVVEAKDQLKALQILPQSKIYLNRCVTWPLIDGGQDVGISAELDLLISLVLSSTRMMQEWLKGILCEASQQSQVTASIDTMGPTELGTCKNQSTMIPVVLEVPRMHLQDMWNHLDDDTKRKLSDMERKLLGDTRPTTELKKLKNM